MDLQIIWFFLWGLLWAVFFMLDGFDFGVGTLLPFLGKTNEEKQIMVHSMGPFWDGNEVWLIAAGGVTFAAFPTVYAVMFSSLYSALMLILFALILRGVSIEFRAKLDDPLWKGFWEIFIFVGSLLPAVLFGVAFANIFQGIPIDGHGVYHGTLFSLLNPFGLLGGVLFLMLFLVHGSLWLAVKTQNAFQEKAAAAAKRLWTLLLISAAAFLVSANYYTTLYNNYLANPILSLIIVASLAALFGIKYFLNKGEYLKAWTSSAVTIVSCTFFGVVGLFPNLFPSSIHADYSLTAFNASSSPLTLKIMLIVVVIFVPIVIAYQAWAYKLFSGKITKHTIIEESY